MGRSEHFLFAPRPSPWPKALVSLACEVDWLSDDSNSTRETVALKSWHVAVCTPIHGGYIVSRKASGATVSGFYAGLREAVERSKGCTILCARTREVAAVLNLWGMLENGEIKIAGTDARARRNDRREMSGLSSDGKDTALRAEVPLATGSLSELYGSMGAEGRDGGHNRARRRGAPSGIMILQDPPIVMELQLQGCQYRFTWVDAANYGIDADAEFGRDEHTAGKLAAWFCSVSSVLKTISDCGWQNTAGSQAMHLFRRTYLETPILSHVHPKAVALETAALFGGRCECYRIGEVAGPVHLYDIRSMYPYICANLSVPVRLCRVVERADMSALHSAVADSFCIADVAIETDSPDYPYRRDNEVIYPVGRYWSCLAGAELEHALRAGNVRGVRSYATYETEQAIARYATDLYGHRQEYDRRGSKAESTYIKRLMVSVVGKFAQRERRWQDMPDSESPFEWGEWYSKNRSGDSERWRSIAYHVQREELGGFSHGAVPSVTVAITSAGRSRLCRILDGAGRQHVVYCDTDAVIVDDYGAECLSAAGWLRPGEWGYLQHVESADGCTIYGDKNYRIGERIRQAGQTGASAANRSCDIGATAQPWIGWSMYHKEKPADWRDVRPFVRGVGRYDRIREAGGVVKPIVIMEW